MPRRPLDVLEASLGDVVTVTLKDDTSYVGRLAGFDQHLNVVLEGRRERTAAENDEGGDSTDTGEDPTQAAGDSADDDRVAEAVPDGDTIVIRGDNVVTITP